MVASYQYDVYGAVRAQSGGSGNEFTYTGEQNDSSGLEYLRARYYDAATGRFLSRDPMPYVQRYAYVANNPGVLTDPTGLCLGIGYRCYSDLKAGRYRYLSRKDALADKEGGPSRGTSGSTPQAPQGPPVVPGQIYQPSCWPEAFANYAVGQNSVVATYGAQLYCTSWVDTTVQIDLLRLLPTGPALMSTTGPLPRGQGPMPGDITLFRRFGQGDAGAYMVQVTVVCPACANPVVGSQDRFTITEIVQ